MSQDSPDDGRVVREFQRETRERLELLDISRLDREEKRRRENELAAGAHRVEYAEREFRKRRPETLGEIKRLVDAMGTPREERLKVGERVFLPPEEALPPTRALTETERRAIERHLGGRVVRASIIYRSSRGHVVEVEHERAGAKEMTLLSVVGERVRDLGDIRARIDRFDPKGAAPVAPTTEAAVAAPAPLSLPAESAPASPAPPLPAESAPPAPPPTLPEAAPAEEGAPKKRFALPKLGRKPKDAPVVAPEAATAPPPEAPAKRFGLPFGKKRKEEDAPPAAEAPSAEAAPDAPADEEKKGLGRFLKRKR